MSLRIAREDGRADLTVMISAKVETILARCMVDSEFLQRFADNGAAALDEYRLDEKLRREFAEIDVGRIKGLAALITKVQLNGLWQHLRFTRTLLKLQGIEPQIFIAYRAEHQQNRAGQGVCRKEQTRRFITFLDEYIASRSGPQYAAIADVLHHERFVWEIGTYAQEHAAGNGASTEAESMHLTSITPSEFWRSVPEIRGLLRTQRFTYDVSALVERISASDPSPPTDCPGAVLAYWFDPSVHSLRIFEVDDLSEAILNSVNGCRSVRAIVDRVNRTEAVFVERRAVRDFLAESINAGLIVLRPARRRSSGVTT
ncbi:MAG: hypothetical protein AABO41_11385 [Acidobacteriota bacterium]